MPRRSPDREAHRDEDGRTVPRIVSLMKLLIATRNKHKLVEIRQILAIPSLELIGMEAYREIPDVVEDGDTFEANARKKAVTLALATGLWTLADDSGLEVDALGGEPGVWSARYAGEPVDYAANNAKLLKVLGNTMQREARFRCVIALSDSLGRAQTVEGRCEGTIIRECRGKEGFGYDPLFVPQGHRLTFAEMESEEKNRISHRGKALQRVAETWGSLLRGEPDALARWG
jgi:XTP/dITP diphosphohydrolase